MILMCGLHRAFELSEGNLMPPTCSRPLIYINNEIREIRISNTLVIHL